VSLLNTQAERNRRLRLDLKRRLRLAGFESDLTGVNDVTTLRNLLDTLTAYEVGQEIEVEFSNLGWVPGRFISYNTLAEEDFRRVYVEALGGGHVLLPERVRPLVLGRSGALTALEALYGAVLSGNRDFINSALTLAEKFFRKAGLPSPKTQAQARLRRPEES
jgi:hypothetical protein